MRVGIVGVGSMGQTHAAGWSKTPADLVGFIADRPETAAPLAATYHARVFGNLEDLLAAVDWRGDPLKEGDLLAATIGPFFAGMDTVANTMGFMVYAILKHPEVYQAIQAEVDEHFASGVPPYQELPKLENLYAATIETLRRYPVAPFTPRGVRQSFTFAGHHVEAGQEVIIVNGLIASVFIALPAAFQITTPVLLMTLLLLVGGLFRSLQFTSINALAFADVPVAMLSPTLPLASALAPTATLRAKLPVASASAPSAVLALPGLPMAVAPVRSPSASPPACASTPVCTRRCCAWWTCSRSLPATSACPASRTSNRSLLAPARIGPAATPRELPHERH